MHPQRRGLTLSNRQIIAAVSELVRRTSRSELIRAERAAPPEWTGRRRATA